MPSAIIVEDEVLAAERLRVLLEECNVVLLNVFHHAMPALEWLSVHEVDIVFADIGMPEIDGLEFVERINVPPNASRRLSSPQPTKNTPCARLSWLPQTICSNQSK